MKYQSIHMKAIIISMGIATTAVAQSAEPSMAELAAKAMVKQQQNHPGKISKSKDAYPWDQVLQADRDAQKKAKEKVASEDIPNLDETSVLQEIATIIPEETLAERYYRAAQDIRLGLPATQPDRLGAMLRRIDAQPVEEN